MTIKNDRYYVTDKSVVDLEEIACMIKLRSAFNTPMYKVITKNGIEFRKKGTEMFEQYSKYIKEGK